MTGLRRGEALALRWDDVDLERGVLTVRRSKTRAGEGRRVDAGPELVGILLAHRLKQDAERAAWGRRQDNGLVFARENGTPYEPTRVTKRFRELAIAAGVRPIRLHDLRHGAASLMLAGGMPLALVSKRLGHSSITITSDTYLHLLEDASREAARVTEAMVPRASRDQSVTTPAGRRPECRPKAAFTQVRRVRREGIEPPTRGLRVRCSAN